MGTLSSSELSAIKSEWRSIATDLTDSFGLSCKLIFAHAVEATPAVSQDPIGKKEAYMPSFGGRSNPRLVPGIGLANLPVSPTGLKIQENTKTITARVYGANKEFKELNPAAGISENVWKMICAKEYSPDLVRCTDAVFDASFKGREIKVKLIMAPVPYGLGGYHQVKTYWVETSNG
jgi:hypothetical protein